MSAVRLRHGLDESPTDAAALAQRVERDEFRASSRSGRVWYADSGMWITLCVA
jgi:hypothetical protein